MCMSYADMTSERLEVHLARYREALSADPDSYWAKKYVSRIEEELKSRAEAGTYGDVPGAQARHLNSTHA